LQVRAIKRNKVDAVFSMGVVFSARSKLAIRAKTYIAKMADDERIFIGFDCAYRSLGWCILGFNPERALRDRDWRNLFRLIAGGVEDVLGEPIADVSHDQRAIRMHACITRITRIIPADIVRRATIVIEHQPRRQSVRGCGNVHGDNQAVEAQLIFYFSTIMRAERVFLIDPKKKDIISSVILHEERATKYAERKKQSRRAYVRLAEDFNFAAHPGARDFKHLKADRSDACIQIFAAVFLCPQNI
jgi:hypothetical protein